MMVAFYAAVSMILEGHFSTFWQIFLGPVLGGIVGTPIIFLLIFQPNYISKILRSSVKNPTSSI
jgi:hypothetical protein